MHRFGQRQQRVAHLRRKLLVLGFLLRKAPNPIDQRADKADGRGPVEILEAHSCRMVRVQHSRGQADQGDRIQNP